jgi:hypothetical protein
MTTRVNRSIDSKCLVYVPSVPGFYAREITKLSVGSPDQEDCGSKPILSFTAF